MQRSFHKKAGFTLIEMIVSLGVFAVVVTITVGAILVLISTNQRLQAEQSVMTNLSFALDTMTREMRTGFNYYCESRANYNAGGPNNIFKNGNDHEGKVMDGKQDCPDGRSPINDQLQGVSFYEGGDSLTQSSGGRRILYFYDVAAKTIMRRLGNADAQSIVSSGLVIKNAQFIVTGSSDWVAPGGNLEQPTITIYLEAQEKDDITAKTYYLQTTVTQRSLDL